jgi:hypothetical protein
MKITIFIIYFPGMIQMDVAGSYWSMAREIVSDGIPHVV